MTKWGHVRDRSNGNFFHTLCICMARGWKLWRQPHCSGLQVPAVTKAQWQSSNTAQDCYQLSSCYCQEKDHLLKPFPVLHFQHAITAEPWHNTCQALHCHRWHSISWEIPTLSYHRVTFDPSKRSLRLSWNLTRLKIKPVSNETRQIMQLHASSKNIWDNRYMKGLELFHFKQTNKTLLQTLPSFTIKLMTAGRKACGITHFLAIQTLFSKSSSSELCFVPNTVLPLWQRLLVAKPLTLSAGSKVSYRQFSWREDAQVMLLCPAAWGWGKSSVPAELSCRWQLWALKKEGHPVHSWGVSMSPYAHKDRFDTPLSAGFLHAKKNVQHCVGPSMWRATCFCAGPGLWKLHSDTTFLSGISQCSLSALVFISEPLGFWAIAFFQSGEPQSTLLHSFKERHTCLLSQLVATAPCSWSLNWFQGTSINAWESEKRWPHCQRVSRLALWVKDICQQLPLE